MYLGGWNIAKIVLCLILGVATVQDYIKSRISNWLIMCGLVLGLIFQIYFHGISGIAHFLVGALLPIILLYLLYLMRVLGAGDIKLFSVIGSFLNFKEMQICILVAFLAGALWSLVRLVHEKTLFLRLEEAIIYFFELASGERKAYVSSGGERSKIHFATCISVGALLAMLI